MARWRVVLELETPLAESEDDVMFSLSWTDVVGPEGDISVLDAEPVEQDA